MGTCTTFRHGANEARLSEISMSVHLVTALFAGASALVVTPPGLRGRAAVAPRASGAAMLVPAPLPPSAFPASMVIAEILDATGERAYG